MQVHIGNLIFYGAYVCGVSNRSMFMIRSNDGGNFKDDHSVVWLANGLGLSIVMLKELWTIMNNNDEEGLVMWKLRSTL